MQRPCDSCGRVYEAKTVRSRFCGSSCRSAAHRARRRKPETASDQRVSVPLQDQEGKPTLTALTRKRLELIGQDEHELGVLTMMLAERLETETVPAGFATLAKEYRSVLHELTDGKTTEVDPLDELAARRIGGTRAAR